MTKNGIFFIKHEQAWFVPMETDQREERNQLQKLAFCLETTQIYKEEICERESEESRKTNLDASTCQLIGFMFKLTSTG